MRVIFVPFLLTGRLSLACPRTQPHVNLFSCSVGVLGAQEYNEMQHLRIMESLGGDTLWSDRFLARHAAIIYFWVLTVVGREGVLLSLIHI